MSNLIELPGGMKLIGKTPPGTCAQCAVEHDPAHPHNQQSLCYQYKFFAEHNRWPRWSDAVAHCPKEIAEYWREELKKAGAWTDEDEADFLKRDDHQ